MNGHGICLVKWGDDEVCGREVHDAPPNTDVRPVCLMHSRDPNKHSGELLEQFNREIKEMIEEGFIGMAANNLVAFDHFVFPQFNFRLLSPDKPVSFRCSFHKSVFTEKAYFGSTLFTGGVDFSDCEFVRDVGFVRCVFGQEANFHNAIFSGEGHFHHASFEKTSQADFSRSRFRRRGWFLGAKFLGPADFSNARFLEGDFSETCFAEDLCFKRAHFHSELKLEAAQIGDRADFEGARICGNASFKRAQFAGRVNFEGTHFRHDGSLRSGPVFMQTEFARPEEVHFYKTNLGHALFYNCDISRVDFSSVEWRKRSNGNCMLFEEGVPLEKPHGTELKTTDGSRDYGLIAQIYQQLKKNYDTQLDYWTADHFHYGEMEMQRRALPNTGRLLGLRQRLHPIVGLAAFYRYASDYGNNYWKPAAWMFATLLLFTILFPLLGLQGPNADLKGAGSPLTYGSAWPSLSSGHDKFWAETKLLGKSMITALDTATFQRNSEYTPAYPQGRIAAILEMLLTSTLFALFLLAIRRQFRR